MKIIERLKEMGEEIPEDVLPILEQVQKCIDCGSTLDDVIYVLNMALDKKKQERISKNAICGG